MEQVKGCYVSIPFGRKLNPVSGALVDYDQIYNEIIRPAVEHAGLTCSRADEFYGGTLVLKSIFSAVIGSELMIADVSAANPNVMYELGVRHATSARPTILLASSDAHVPYHLTSTYYLRYDLNPSGSVTGPAAANLMALLARAIDMSLRTPVAFSPIFELFPEMQPNVSAVLSGPFPKDTEGDASLGRKTRHSHVSAAEQAMHKTEADPAAMLAIIKGYREVSAWDDLVRFVDTLPENVRQLPEVVQTLALALNRRVRPGDRKRAEALLTQLIEQTGGDGETFGILGRIYKDCFRESGESSFWRKAYEAYRKGFEVEPDRQIATLDGYKIDALDELLRYPPHHVGILSKLDEFHKRGAYEKSVFIMTKFPGGNKTVDKGLEKVIKLVQKGVTDAGFVPRIASEKDYHELLWHNVALCMLGCSKGIAIVESMIKAELNPNVAMEWGWMRAMNKPVLFLAEKSFDLDRADWTGLIEHEFLWDKPGAGIKAAVKKFLS